MTSQRKDEKTFTFSVIAFREDAEWTAVTLEMDLRGYGSTPQEAFADVIDMVKAQVSFAVQRKHPESVWRRAEEKYWRMFEEARRNHFVAELSNQVPTDDRLAEYETVPLSLVALKQGDQWAGTRA